MISAEFAAAVLAVDLETPVFSEARLSLLHSVPESFTTVPNEPYPDSLIRKVIAQLERRIQLRVPQKPSFSGFSKALRRSTS